MALGASLEALCALAAAGEGLDGAAHAVAAAIDELDQRFLKGAEGSADPFRLWALARQMDAYLVARDDLDRRGKGRGRIRRWAHLQRDLKAFCDVLHPRLPVCRADVRTDDLRALRDYSTASSRKEHLYSSLTLFLLNAVELEPALLTAMQVWLPTSEQTLLADIHDRLLKPLISGVEAAPEPDVEAVPAEPAESGPPTVKMGFAFRDADRTAFDTFFQRFASPVDGAAHFVGYRNGLRSPDAFAKSFLAISPPKEEGRDWHTFAHFYKAPSRGDQSRVSTGFVLPLEDGVYLVGGQYQMLGEVKRYDIFKTVEVIAWSWDDLTVPESLFGGLVLSSNYRSEHMVARSCFRATPIHHSGRLLLDLIGGEGLLEDLTKDLAAEAKLEQGVLTHGAPTWQVNRILGLTRNAPAEWHVPPLFRPAPGAERTKALTKALVSGDLDDAFGTIADPKYLSTDEDHRAFDFWRDIRFGALGRSP